MVDAFIRPNDLLRLIPTSSRKRSRSSSARQPPAGQGAGAAPWRIRSSPIESVQGRTDLSLMTPRALKGSLSASSSTRATDSTSKIRSPLGGPGSPRGPARTSSPASASLRRYARCSGRCLRHEVGVVGIPVNEGEKRHERCSFSTSDSWPRCSSYRLEGRATTSHRDGSLLDVSTQGDCKRGAVRLASAAADASANSLAAAAAVSNRMSNSFAVAAARRRSLWIRSIMNPGSYPWELREVFDGPCATGHTGNSVGA